MQYEVRYEPVQGGRRKRQEVSGACQMSPCNVPVEDGRVTIIGLDAAADYTVTVQPFNGEQERGQAQVHTGMASHSWHHVILVSRPWCAVLCCDNFL